MVVRIQCGGGGCWLENGKWRKVFATCLRSWSTQKIGFLLSASMEIVQTRRVEEPFLMKSCTFHDLLAVCAPSRPWFWVAGLDTVPNPLLQSPGLISPFNKHQVREGSRQSERVFPLNGHLHKGAAAISDLDERHLVNKWIQPVYCPWDVFTWRPHRRVEVN